MSKRPIEIMAESLNVPDTAYQDATKRYRDLGDWLHDKSKSKCSQFAPEVFPQGSFRLGTAIKPWKREDYDLDLGCTLKTGITAADYTQEQLKSLVGKDLDTYRKERGIVEPIEEKCRCWRLKYHDASKFHMDIVPSIPHDALTRQAIHKCLRETGSSVESARNISELALAITDNRHPHYRNICSDWKISNTEGYAIWFESRMRQARQLLESRATAEKVASINDLPAYRWKTPLQYAVQILKRHRDIMFEKNQEYKPISIIITTLAARAYSGESDIQSALSNILSNMSSYVLKTNPRVPNPVNPKEDFADKWGMKEYSKYHLEENYFGWVEQAAADFQNISTATESESFKKWAFNKYGSVVDDKVLSGLFGTSTMVSSSPKVQHISSQARPHGMDRKWIEKY